MTDTKATVDRVGCSCPILSQSRVRGGTYSVGEDEITGSQRGEADSSEMCVPWLYFISVVTPALSCPEVGQPVPAVSLGRGIYIKDGEVALRG